MLNKSFKKTLGATLDQFGNPSFNDIFQGFDKFFENFIPSYHTTTDDGSLLFSVDVPGVKEEDIAVEITSNLLTVKGERKDAHSSYSINRSFSIPEGFDGDQVKAELSNGVLSITIPNKPLAKKEETKKVSIISNK